MPHLIYHHVNATTLQPNECLHVFQVSVFLIRVQRSLFNFRLYNYDTLTDCGTSCVRTKTCSQTQ